MSEKAPTIAVNAVVQGNIVLETTREGLATGDFSLNVSACVDGDITYRDTSDQGGFANKLIKITGHVEHGIYIEQRGRVNFSPGWVLEISGSKPDQVKFKTSDQNLQCNYTFGDGTPRYVISECASDAD